MTVAITAFPVYAQTGEQQENDSEIVYENELGARLTASEYNKMLEYITEEEMLEDVNVVNKPLNSYGLSYKLEDNVTTDMKKIKMKIASNGATVKKVELTCEWIKTPKVKSYDIIAIRVNQNVKFSADENCYGKQYADNASKHKLELYANVAANNQSMIIFGTYQHAISDVTLSKSQKYNFSSKGMGGVIDFTTTEVYEKYDQTPGLAVWVTYE